MNILVTALDIKRHTTVGQNADDKKLSDAVPDSETRHLRPLLGPQLFEQLRSFVLTAPEPPALLGLSAQDEAAAVAAHETKLAAWRSANPSVLLALWDAVKPCLCQWALVEAWPDLLVHIDGAGVNVKTGNSQGTTVADAATLNRIWDNHRDKAIWRGDELMAWLESKKTDYAAYVTIKPLPTGRQPIDYFGGISLG